MKRQFFIKVLPLIILTTAWCLPPKKTAPEFYKLTIYQYTTPEQEEVINSYLKNALLPALHRHSIKAVGIFKAIANDTAAIKKMYVLIPVKKLHDVDALEKKLLNDTAYNNNGAGYINAVYTKPAYSRMETILLKAFCLAPISKMPDLKTAKKDRVYELRSYESASEKIYRNKVQMFNEGDEISIFSKLNFNAVFYAEVIAGSKMPNLMYMTSFENMDDRNAHWKAFGSDTSWKRLSALPEYQHNVSRNEITFLRGVDYSDF